jgi:hypothetical protein
MARDLDREWQDQLPSTRPQDLSFTFYGYTLERLPEVPLDAFMTLELDTENKTTTVLEAIRECLADGSRETWDSIVGRAAAGSPGDPDYRPAVRPQPGITIPRVMVVWRYLVEAGSGRPTDRASGSSSGRSSNGTTSTDGSPAPSTVTLPASPPVA